MNKESKYIFTLVVVFLSSIIFCFAQQKGPNQGDLENSFEYDNPILFQKSELDSLIKWQEHIVLHVAKSKLKQKVPVFFKAYALTGPNRLRASISKVLKVELLNSEHEIVVSQYHKLQDGMAEGAITIPRKLKDGIYTLRAYTRWMQNYGESFYFTKQMELRSKEFANNKNSETLNQPSISFHPEGGQLITSLKNKLFIKINEDSIDEKGFVGEIVDDNNNAVAKAVPFGSGLLSVIFTPRLSNKYRLKVGNEHFYDLPPILTSGYVLNVNNLDAPMLSMRIETTSGNLKEKVWLKGELNGVTYFEKEIEFQKSLINLNVPTQGIPAGILVVSLYDDKGNRLAKRPVGIEANNNLKLKIISVEKDVAANERSFNIRVTDANGKPVTSEVSLSATTNESYSTAVKDKSITDLNWEDQDLDVGNTKELRKKRFLKDLGLLTLAGDSDLMTRKLPESIQFPVQKGLDLFGLAYNLNNELLKNTQIQLLGASDENVIIETFETDASGRVRIENLQLMGKTELIFRTAGDDTSSRLVKIVPFQERFGKKKLSKSRLDFTKQKKGKITNTSPWQPDVEGELVILDEVEVIEKKKLERKTSPSVYGVEPTRVKFQDPERPKTIPQLFLGIPGLNVIGLGGLQPEVIMPRAAGAGPVLWVLDGMPLIQPTSLVDILGLVSHTDVERIEILYSATAAIYGSRASGGAIVIYTRSGADLDYVNRKEGRLNFQGYFESPTFKDHIDEVINNPKKYVDSATTLFWSTNIKTDKNGEATIRFKVPFDYKHLELKASTINEDGDIGSARVVF